MASKNAEAGAVAGNSGGGATTATPTTVSQPAGAKPVVCFLGPITSYTHQATLSAFPPDKFELMPVVTIKDIFETTQSGRASYGVVPFENSTNGSVVFTLDCFADRAGACPDLSVCAEIYLDVHHCLVGRRRRRRQQQSPSSSADSNVVGGGDGGGGGDEEEGEEDLSRAIRRVYSHPQAFGQCTRFLGTRLRGVETVDVSSTSRAAEIVRDESESSSFVSPSCSSSPASSSSPSPPSSSSSSSSEIFEAAAISSAPAAEMLGLDILARNIEDRADNTTRFFVLRKGAGEEEEGVDIESLLCRSRARGPATTTTTTTTSSSSEETPPSPSPSPSATTTKSLVSFTVPHRSPGALADVLDCFRRSGLNLTSISSRPSLVPDTDDGGNGNGSASFQYIFFVEFEGHRFRDPEGRVRDALAGVAAAARRWRWLGSWENMLLSLGGR
ncbi:putative prephenate dehydratase protein [Eutypa lata UCREL1]|uniref:prephenate dehydratase n=1 Tax=Eutypa lata (strain UCR-EL1) TaxID=1287681 RepID=M7SEC0_EUTLA|nr:putative prephenate dehydratase protein [Eutypa lata UCREL1]